ncbi:MAG TPA: hypothetical protein VF540_03225 [Segetibacter sp.]
MYITDILCSPTSFISSDGNAVEENMYGDKYYLLKRIVDCQDDYKKTRFYLRSGHFY